MEVYALASFHRSTGFYSVARVCIYCFSIHFMSSSPLSVVQEILGLDFWLQQVLSRLLTCIQTTMDLAN